MNILYCGDKNIADGVLISALSLSHHCNEKLNIYILTAGIETASRSILPLKSDFGDFLDKELKKINEENAVTLIDVTELFLNEPPDANMDTRFTPCCMLRLYADLVPEIPDRILYLDNDVICRADFSHMYYQNMENLEIAGVLDHYGKHFFRNNIFKKDYINSGVLLINMHEVRRSGLFENCRHRCKERKMFMPDQSALNKLAKNKRLLPRKYNEQKKLKSDTVFQHFTTSFKFSPLIKTVTVKPWQVQKMHDVLNLYEYDHLLNTYQQLKNEYENKECILK